MKEEDNFYYYNRKFFLNNIKFLLLKIIMLGKCKKNQIDKYTYIRDNLEAKMDKIEEKYNLLLAEFVVTENLIQVNTNKESFFKNNYKQIDNFFNYIDKLNDEEKNKIFS